MPADIRHATVSDAASISAIYGHAVLGSVATFDVADPPITYWRERITSTEAGNHMLVLVDSSLVVGFAYSSAFRPRPGYARTRETSIYLAPSAVGAGLGTRLYAHLAGLLRLDGMHLAVAVIAQPNPASVALHERVGFEQVGTMSEVGRKFGRWVDTRWYQLRLDLPAPPTDGNC